MIKYCVIGCGDVGRRIAIELIDQGVDAADILALVKSPESAVVARALGLQVEQFDFDAETLRLPESIHGARWCYLVPPQKIGETDLRSQTVLRTVSESYIKPNSLALISTTGVYGDTDGDWVDESTPTNPVTERGLRRLDMEDRWLVWAAHHRVPIRVLRVPGIYANSRIPLARLKNATPVVRAEECGYSNRIHADDLAVAVTKAMHYEGEEVIFNATDGSPGKISEYLQTAAEVAGLPPLPEISMAEAKDKLSAGMLSYLAESRRIRNTKLIQELKVALRYPDFREGLRH